MLLKYYEDVQREETMYFGLSSKSWILQKRKIETQQLLCMNGYTIMPRGLYTAIFSYLFSSQNRSKQVIYCPPPLQKYMNMRIYFCPM